MKKKKLFSRKGKQQIIIIHPYKTASQEKKKEDSQLEITNNIEKKCKENRLASSSSQLPTAQSINFCVYFCFICTFFLYLFSYAQLYFLKMLRKERYIEQFIALMLQSAGAGLKSQNVTIYLGYPALLSLVTRS